MKNYTKTIYKLFMGAVIMALPLQTAIASAADFVTNENEIVVKDKFAGGWAYTVAGAPEGYGEGFLLILQDEKTYKVQVQIGGATMLGENVTTKGSTIMFDVMVEGDKVGVSLTVSGSKISGTSNSSQGTFSIEGKKTLSAE